MTENPWALNAFKSKTISSLPDTDLIKLAKDIAQNLVFTSDHIRSGDDNIITSIFMPLALGALSDFNKEEIDDIGMIYCYYGKDQGGWAVNGYPTFFSCAFLNKKDTKFVWEKVKKIEELMKEI